MIVFQKAGYRLLTSDNSSERTSDGEHIAMPADITANGSGLKRIFDVIVASMLLVVISPVLCMIAAVVKMSSPGPVLFLQPRIGLNSKMFICYKFRTMYAHQSDRMAAVQTQRNDARVTRVGRFLRHSNLDELPQLVNVLRGEMSLVGPRPHAPLTNIDGVLLENLVPEYKCRHAVRPGLTGLAQVKGYRGPIHDLRHLARRVQYDLEYISHWTFILDLKILFVTLRSRDVT